MSDVGQYKAPLEGVYQKAGDGELREVEASSTAARWISRGDLIVHMGRHVHGQWMLSD